jgi:hypothetical protein
MTDSNYPDLTSGPTPWSLRDRKGGRLPSVARILDLIDTDSPAFGRIASILSDMAESGVELDEAAVRIAVKLGSSDSRTFHPADTSSPAQGVNPGLPMWGAGADRSSIVYYIRRGDLVKIGTTTRPHARFEVLMPDEILAFEPGGREIELYRHKQFSHLRVGGREYFHSDLALTKHVKRMRRTHGEPDPSWPTTGSTITAIPRLSRELDRPETSATATATEIAEILGIARGRIYVWANRGQLKPVAGGNPRRPLYFVDQVRQLAEQSRAWQLRENRSACEF